ncbi:MAG: hypothetical protein LBJ19_01520, partial [Holosporaceae bacterium]|nr:hypothetical protein [Holosporaceae bacterium]
AIINHPYIIDEIVENFAQMNFSLPHLKMLQEKIMEYYEKYLTIGDRKAYLDHMFPLQKDVDDFSDNAEMHAKFIGKSSSDKKVIDGWRELYKKYSTNPMMIKDLQNAAIKLGSTFSDNDWLRLRALKKEFLSTINCAELKQEK